MKTFKGGPDSLDFPPRYGLDHRRRMGTIWPAGILFSPPFHAFLEYNMLCTRNIIIAIKPLYKYIITLRLL